MFATVSASRAHPLAARFVFRLVYSGQRNSNSLFQLSGRSPKVEYGVSSWTGKIGNTDVTLYLWPDKPGHNADIQICAKLGGGLVIVPPEGTPIECKCQSKRETLREAEKALAGVLSQQ